MAADGRRQLPTSCTAYAARTPGERRRVARELHEVYVEEDPRRGAAATPQRDTVRRALEQVRALSSDLHSREVDDGLEHALTDYPHMVAPPVTRWVTTVSGDDSGLPTEPRDELYLSCARRSGTR
jgi:hypothetical protein